MAALLVGAACQRSPDASNAIAPPRAAPDAPAYSPFVVEVHGDVPYRTITFKQVGSLSASVDRGRLFEALAESLVLDLVETEGHLTVGSAYAPEVAQPSFHRACGAAHIYVDFWEEEGDPPGWGFSLWSGCGPGSRFALESVQSPARPRDEVVDQVAPLSERIARALGRARAQGCFRRAC